MRNFIITVLAVMLFAVPCFALDLATDLKLDGYAKLGYIVDSEVSDTQLILEYTPSYQIESEVGLTYKFVRLYGGVDSLEDVNVDYTGGIEILLLNPVGLYFEHTESDGKNGFPNVDVSMAGIVIRIP